MIERPPHLPHTPTPAPHLGPASPPPDPSRYQRKREWGGRQEGAAPAAAAWGLAVSLAL